MWATEASEGTNTSRHSRESHVETRSTSRCVLQLLCWCWRHAACIPPGTASACSGPKLKGRLHSAHTGSMFPMTLWESPRSKIQRFSSGDFRTPVRGQAVKQSAMMRSALEFFATAQSCCERSLESVNRYRASHGDDGPPLQGQDSGKSSYVQWAFRQLWRKYGVGLHPRNLSSMLPLTQHFIAWCWAGIPTRSPRINTSTSSFFRCR